MPDARLVYFMGPSGAGKDSVLHWLRQHLGNRPQLHWAQRTITRPADDATEQHQSVEEAHFLHLLASGAFALHWFANDTHYGVRHVELHPLQQGRWVFLNGSRAYLRVVQERFGVQLLPILITASPAVLRQRLQGRGREDAAAIEARMHRSQQIQGMDACFELLNDQSIEQAGMSLLQYLQQQTGWPA